MKTQHLSLLFMGVGMAALAIALVIMAVVPQISQGSTWSFGPFLGTATTSRGITLTSSQVVLGTTTNALGDGSSYTRVFAVICNPNAAPVVINMNNGRPAATTSAVAFIAAAAGYDTCFEINDRNPYNGAVTASSTGINTLINVTEYVQ